MKNRKYLFILLLIGNYSCLDTRPTQSQSFGDMIVVGQKMVDVLLTPDKVNGMLYITSKPNDQIISLRGTSNYENLIGVSHTKIITGNLRIMNNNELSDLSPLDSLTSIGKSIDIEYCPKISKLNFISNLDKINGISLRNIGISNLDFIKRVKNINGTFSLSELNNLQDFTSLDIEFVENLFLDSLVYMEDTKFLSKLIGISDNIFIVENPNLKKVSLILENKNLEGHLNISSNKLLTEINGFDQIRIINKELHIIGNESITNLDFLKSLKQVNGSIMIRGNPNLVDFSALSNIQLVKGSVQIEDNGPIDTKMYSQIMGWEKKWKAGANK